MKLDLSKIQIPIKQSNPQRPPIAEFINDAWVIRQDYPASSSISGTYVVLSADGSAKKMTIDKEGNIIDEFNLNERKDKSDV